MVRVMRSVRAAVRVHLVMETKRFRVSSDGQAS